MRALLLLAVLALLLAAPLAAADKDGAHPREGPEVRTASAAPNPAHANALFTVTAVVALQGSPLSAVRVAIGPYLSAPLEFAGEDLAFGLLIAQGTFVASFPAGDHVAAVTAEDVAGKIGAPFTFPLTVLGDEPDGPVVESVALSPGVAVQGSVVRLSVVVSTAESSQTIAEFFVARLGGDGTGTPFPGPVLVGGDLAFTAFVDTSSIAPGIHRVFVHAGLAGDWGAVRDAWLTVEAPLLRLSALLGASEATPGSVVPLTVTIWNDGGADPADVQLDVYTGAYAFVAGDTLGDRGARFGRYSYALRWPAGADFFLLVIDLAVAPMAPDGAAVGANLALQYASTAGRPYDPVHAEAALEVRATEFVVAIAAPAQAHPLDDVTVQVSLDNVGSRVIDELVLDLAASPWLTLVSHNAAEIGGTPEAGRGFVFRGLEPGARTFLATYALALEAPDRTVVAVDYTAAFDSRYGPSVLFTGRAETLVLRPALSVSVEAGAGSLPLGKTATAEIRVRNTGSAAAQALLRIEAVGPLALDGVSVPYRRAGEAAVVDLGSVEPGETRVQVEVAALAGAGRVAALRATVEYATPTGRYLGSAAGEAEFSLLAAEPPAGPPQTPLPLAPPAAAAASAAAASLGVLGFAATERGKAAFLFFFLPLYSRLKREQILDHETRGMIRGYVLANPGDHFNSIKETLDLNNGTLAYHLNVLEKEGIIRSVKDGKFRRFFPAEMKIPHNGELPTKVQRLILEIVLETPAISQKEISKLLGLSQSTISYHLDRLKELGLVRAERRGLQLCYFVQPEGIEVLTVIG